MQREKESEGEGGERGRDQTLVQIQKAIDMIEI